MRLNNVYISVTDITGFHALAISRQSLVSNDCGLLIMPKRNYPKDQGRNCRWNRNSELLKKI